MSEPGPRPRGAGKKSLLPLALFVALGVLVLSLRSRRDVPVEMNDAGEAETQLVSKHARWTLSPILGQIEVTSNDRASTLRLSLSLVVDGGERALVFSPADVRRADASSVTAVVPIFAGDDRAEGTLSFALDAPNDRLLLRLAVKPARSGARHTYALRLGAAPELRTVFVPGVGKANDEGERHARIAVVDDDLHPTAVYSPKGELSIVTQGPDLEAQSAEPRLTVTTEEEAFEPSVGSSPSRSDVEVGIQASASSQELWGAVYRALGIELGRVTGVVTGTRERAHVHARGDDGHPYARAVVGGDGRFALEVPKAAVLWHATVQTAEASPPIRFPPGTPWDLSLDVAPGGEVHVRVIDADSGKPLIARLLVKGIEGSADPNFGPDYRASGAGPLMDLLDGEATTPLPRGRFRISTTHGLEWTIDAVNVEITSGHTEEVELQLRHVVPTPGWVGCDLHVHARPSFDTPVTVEDRVLSLASAGVDFAVPTEHNIVGDYGPSTELLKLGTRFASVPGVEVTTYNPRFGHFGVFPYPVGANVPPFKGTSAGAIFAAGHRGDPSRIVQVNHPRLAMGIGYFGVVGFDPKSGRVPPSMRTEFDTLEVYSGYEAAHREQVERVMEDWYALLNMGKRVAATGSSDSHRIQYQWAGYPRTFAMLDPKLAGDTGLAVDTKEIVAALKKGRSIVTSGPLIELELGDGTNTARAGETLSDVPRPLVGTLRVRAAPWIDVTSIDVVVGIPGTPLHLAHADAGTETATPGIVKVLHHVTLPSRPTSLGREEGTLEEASARTVRWSENLSLDVPEGARWILAIARGDRLMDDALPFMRIQPMGFSNPIWLGQ